MIWLVIWALIGVGIGFLGFALAPPMLAMFGGYDAKERVGQWYVSLAQTAVGDSAIIAREQGGLSLASISYDPKFQADRATVDGESGHVVDDFGDKSRLANKPFGISLESHPVYISPLKAEFAEAMTSALDNDRLGIQPDGGMRLDFELPKASQLPVLRDAHRFLAGDCKRRYGEISEEWTKKSQEGFHDRITLGETMLIIMAFAVGAVSAWFVLSYGDVAPTDSVKVPVSVGLLALSLPGVPARVLSTKRRRQLQLTGVLAVAGVVSVAAAYLVAKYYGLPAAILFSVCTAVTAFAPWMTIRVMGSSTPLGGIWARGLWILAQLSTGRGGLVRADTGHYEYHPLQEDRQGFFVEMDNGDDARIDGDDGDLYRFAWRPLAISEQKTDRNLGPYTVEEEEIAKPETRETRQDYDVHHPKKYHRKTWLLSAARLKNLARGSAGAKLVRNGRNKALEEDGGTKQVKPIHTMLFAGAMLIVGFGLAYFALGGAA